MKIGIAADHAGQRYLKLLRDDLLAQQYRVIDLTGDNIYNDYPDVARLAAKAFEMGTIDRGILICGSGVGVAIAANKFAGIRASLCHDTYSAHQGVEHDNMNVICIGQRVVGEELAREIVMHFIRAEFKPKERYIRRLEKIDEIEKSNFRQQINRSFY